MGTFVGVSPKFSFYADSFFRGCLSINNRGYLASCQDVFTKVFDFFSKFFNLYIFYLL